LNSGLAQGLKTTDGRVFKRNADINNR